MNFATATTISIPSSTRTQHSGTYAQNKPRQKTRARLQGREPAPKSLLTSTPEQMVHYYNWSHPAPGASVQTTASGFKTISKRVVTKDTTTGRKKIKVLWILTLTSSTTIQTMLLGICARGVSAWLKMGTDKNTTHTTRRSRPRKAGEEAT